MTAKDYLGNELLVGDEVVFMQLNYRGLMKGVISKISPKKVTISHKPTNTCSVTSIQFHNQTIKLTSKGGVLSDQ